MAPQKYNFFKFIYIAKICSSLLLMHSAAAGGWLSVCCSFSPPARVHTIFRFFHVRYEAPNGYATRYWNMDQFPFRL